MLGAAGPARAADATTLYVQQTSAACTDGGPGTSAQPFCTVGAAAAVVSAGQTVMIGAGSYPERVTLAKSGTPDQPITFRIASALPLPTLVGPTAGFVIDGQHDIKILNVRVNGTEAVPALDIRASSGITVQATSIQMTWTATAPAIRLAAVTQSWMAPYVHRAPAGGIILDAETTGVEVRSGSIYASGEAYGTSDSAGVRVTGPGNTVAKNMIHGFREAEIVLEPGAAGTPVVNNAIGGGAGFGILNRGASGTAITNNHVENHCRDGIRVEGASSGVSVQNNRLSLNGNLGQDHCDGLPVDGVEIGVYDGAVGDTVVDYNDAHHLNPNSPAVYAWDGVRMSLAAFRAASGQAAHDRETAADHDAIDSANSAAPGYPQTDREGAARIDDPGVPNTGAGPVTYADRGTREVVRRASARSSVAVDLAASSVTVDASASEAGTHPIVSYTFDFGDGTTTTQAAPTISHRYAQPGEYQIRTTVNTADGLGTSVPTQRVTILPASPTAGLLSLYNLNYVAVATNGLLGPGQPGLTAAGGFDIGDAGGGEVALVSRATGMYLSADSMGTGPLTMFATNVGPTERFTLVRNTDGSISLRSVHTLRYVSIMSQTSPYLGATRTAIGTWEKFHPVKVSDAARTLKASANGKFVSAESAGTKPLIASRPAANTWERFDIVDLGNGQVALFARANNRFVAAENAGAQPLQAKRLAVSAWERFTLVRNGDGTVSFRSATNNLYVSAESAGTLPLIASRPAVGTWEKFNLG
ncbi:PKD domain-containing protein [Phytohabitans sp. LJ34]|uniref:PKD domain-containing protein n=1 Tax=Phytohabitans sp. LJ34 TaxID=3452217 RepID=UPI003F89B112